MKQNGFQSTQLSQATQKSHGKNGWWPLSSAERRVGYDWCQWAGNVVCTSVDLIDSTPVQNT